jgi:inositol oxygenase
MHSVCIIGYGRAGKIHHAAATGIFRVSCIVDLCGSAGSRVDPSVRFDTDVTAALRGSEVDLVIITTPTSTHYEMCKLSLEMGKHVVIEKPLASCPDQIEELYMLASEKKKLLFVAFNRRHDPEWISLGEKLEGEYPLHANVLCRDFPHPPLPYLRTCGGIFRDAAIHDLDMMCCILHDTPVEVTACLDERGENSSIVLTFSRGCCVRMIHSRHSTFYDQRVQLLCSSRMVEMASSPEESTSFQARYHTSYISQLRDVSERITAGQVEPNISLTHSLLMEQLVRLCDASARDGATKSMQTLRAFEEARGRVKELYRRARSFHTVERGKRLREKYRPGTYGSMTIWQALEELGAFVDLSDPDVDVPNEQHALQTAESIRRAGLPEWMQLVGLIHDFGKVLYKWGCDEDGTSLATQWSLVGDTFVVGCELPDTLTYPEFNEGVHTGDGEYEAHCGLDQCYISFGHDEYLYQVLRASNVTLPPQALKIVRYHSLYAWHDRGSYGHLESEVDQLALGWIKLFNSHDLYSKTNATVELSEVRQHYDDLAKRFLPDGLCF